MTSELELAYIAGILDGEGCITGALTRGKYFQIHVEICNSNLEIIEWLQSKIGGSISVSDNSKNRSKDIYHLLITSDVLYKFLCDVEPFVKIKKQQLDIAKLFCETKGKRFHEVNMVLHDRLRELNKKGRSV